jgi:hypothetical protein
MNNQPPEPPPMDEDDLIVTDDLAASEYDKTFADDPFTFGAMDWLADEGSSNPVADMQATLSDTWSWVDAKLIGVERAADDGTQFEIGCIDVYADTNTGDLGAHYLPIATFSDVDVAAAFYHDLQRDIHENDLSLGGISTFAEEAATRFNPASSWRSATVDEYSAYETLRDADSIAIDHADTPPPTIVDELVQAAAELTGAQQLDESFAATFENKAAFQALSAIGIDAEGFDPAKDPPPFYDAESGTAYWIGVFQADEADRENCITSILSLGRNAETGTLEAQLAPCLPGNWDKTYGAAEYLIDVAQRNGIAHCFDAAEGMALATEQRELWETSLGLPLESDTAQAIADYTRDIWEMEL